ncbi:MAG: nicotinate-nicotinamide nucleotide adenylyltransferase [Actinomycetota bacterium]
MNVDPFDLASLLSLRELIGSVGRGGLPELSALAPIPQARSIAILPGSFNPPTAAHVLLAERALSEGFDRVVYAYARSTVGKRPNGLIPEDRMLAVRAAATEAGMSIAVCSHGLYADLAEAAAAAFGEVELSFLVGSDKVIQIFEERWYENREAALDRLFSRARLVVAPRADQGERLKVVLRAPENRRFSDRVDILRLHPAVSDLSSTRVRGLLRSGADPTGLLPQSVADVLVSVRAFAAPEVVDGEEVDAYHVRAQLVDAFWRWRGNDATGATASIDLCSLWRAAVAPGENGKRLRALIVNGSLDEDVLHAAAAAG